MIAWNTDTSYLLDLAAAGVPVVPSVFVAPGEVAPAAVAPRGDWVIKPAVSGSAADTGRFRDRQDPSALALVERIHRQGRTVLMQPYCPAIETDGETSVVFLGGVFSHAVRREPLLTERGERAAVTVGDVLPRVRGVVPTDVQLAVAESALNAVPGGAHDVAYARVDLIPGPSGPLLLELEATDPFLFLSFATDAARRRLADSATRALAPSA